MASFGTVVQDFLQKSNFEGQRENSIFHSLPRLRKAVPEPATYPSEF